MNSILTEVASQGLKDLQDYYGNHSCNDYFLEDTPENRGLVKEFNEYMKTKDPMFSTELLFHNGKILTFDDITIFAIKKLLQFR